MARSVVAQAPRRAGALIALAAFAACVHDVHRLGAIGPPSSPRKAEVRVLLFGAAAEGQARAFFAGHMHALVECA